MKIVFLTARPGAWRGSRFRRGLFLTARPGAWHGSRFRRGLFFFNRAAMGRARFLFYTRFIFFLVLSVTRPSPSLGQVLVGTLNHATCNVYSPKAFETLIHIVFFIVSQIYFLFILSKCSIQSERTCQNVQGLRHW